MIVFTSKKFFSKFQQCLENPWHDLLAVDWKIVYDFKVLYLYFIDCLLLLCTVWYLIDRLFTASLYTLFVNRKSWFSNPCKCSVLVGICYSLIGDCYLYLLFNVWLCKWKICPHYKRLHFNYYRTKCITVGMSQIERLGHHF